MPVSWIPKKRTLEGDIQEELTRLALLEEGKTPPGHEEEITPKSETWRPVTALPPADLEPSIKWQPTAPSVAVMPSPQIPLKPEAEWYEKPKEWTEEGMEALGRGMAKVPLLPEALQWAAPAFEFIHEKLEKPWAAIITSPWSPEVEWKEGESWLEHEKREYERWKAPTYVKGATEFAMPLWWMPWLGWFTKGAKAAAGGSTLLKTGGILPKAARETLYPSYEVLQKGIPQNITKKMSMWAEHVPVVNRMVKAVGGESAFIRRNPQTLADQARNYGVFRGIHRDMGNNIVDAQMPDLYVKLGKSMDESKIFKYFDIEKVGDDILNAKVGVVTTDAAHPGLQVGGKTSYFFHDVWQNPNLYKWTDEVAYEYVKEAHRIVGWFEELALANGTKIPKKHIQSAMGDILEHHITRIAKGKMVEGKLAPFRKTNPFTEQIYETMKEGVEAGVRYGGTLHESVELLARATTRRIADHYFDVSVKQLGKTSLQRLEELYPELLEKFGYHTNRIGVLQKAMSELKLAKPFKGGYRPIHGTALNTISNEFPTLATRMAGAMTIRPQAVVDYIKKMSTSAQVMFGKDVKPVVEALAALPQRASLDDALKVVTKFAKNEQKATRLIERIYKKNARAELGEYKKAIDNILDDTSRMLNSEKAALAPFKAEVTKLKRQLGRGRVEYGEAKFRTHPAFNKQIFPTEVVNTLSPVLERQGGEWIRNMAQVSGASRMLVAALDLSAPFIQGLMVFGKNPMVWSKSVAKMMRIATNPYKYYVEAAARKTSIMDRVMYGGSTSVIDYFEAMPVLKKLSKTIAGTKGEAAIRQTYGRAEMAFLGFGEIARDEMWKAGKFMLAKKGLAKAAEETQLKELARSLDRMTGVMSSEALGVSLTQRNVESAWVFFAPRYTRAGLSYMADMLRGGFTGAEARKALAGTLLGGMTMYQGVCSMTGQQPNYNPNSARFMTVKVGDRHVGVGGIYYATMRLMANIAATAKETPEDLSPLNLSRVDNPFYKYLYSRTAPLTGLFTGLAIEHKNYFGEPFENGVDYLQFISDKVLPIAVQSVVPWDRKPWEKASPLPILGAEVAGLRTFPKSSWEVRDESREGLARETYRRPWDDLTRAEQRELEAKSPILVKLDEEVAAQQRRRGDPEDILFSRWQDEIDQSKGVRDDRIRMAAQQAQKTGDSYWFKEIVSDIENDYSARMEFISEKNEYAPIFELLNDPERQITENQKLDAAYNEWASLRYSKGDTRFGQMETAFGEPVWDNIEKLRTYIANKYGADALNYIETERPLAGRDLPPLYLELVKARRIMRPYWKVRDWAEKHFGKPKTEWQQRRIDRFVSKVRKQLRRQNPEMERAYQQFYVRH